MATTYNLIHTENVASSVPTVVFSNIPATYTDLVLCGSIRASTSVIYGSGFFQFNGVTSGYDNRRMVGYYLDNGKSFSDSNYPAALFATAQSSVNTANWFTPVWLYIPNYAGTSQVKITGGEASYQNSGISDKFYIQTIANRTGSTAAISSITIMDPTGGYGNTLQYSTLSLYGILKT